ncbi:hypothetical protein V3C99_014764, partial [Haemonchus contortus]|uniref:Rap-GAP domain-containing protein n=1 Tax=Haemonchus contortus TaxID=6289 RepID=A0A7I4YSH4_HAECO
NASCNRQGCSDRRVAVYDYQIGLFDVIILIEVTHEISQFSSIPSRFCLKDNAPIVILYRPKNPPIPIPDCCLFMWRKLAPTREAITAAAKVELTNGRTSSSSDSSMHSLPMIIREETITMIHYLQQNNFFDRFRPPTRRGVLTNS